jgi:methanogenic corrinoid protein MtbC1
VTAPELRRPDTDIATRQDFPIDGALADGDCVAGIDVVTAAMDAGASPVAVLLDVLAPALARITARAALGLVPVARLRRATAVASKAAETLAEQVPEPLSPKGKVLVACPRYDWYTASATILSVTLRAAGWTAVDLRTITTGAQLADHVNELGPDIVAVHCSVPAGLPAARGLTATALENCVPVLACGPAFGVDGLRADTLGASAWAHDPRAAIDAIERLPVVVTAARPSDPTAHAELADLELRHSELVETVTERWAALAGQVDAAGWGRFADLAEATVANTLYAVRGALVTADPRLAVEAVDDQRRLLRVRGVDAHLLPLIAPAARAPLHDLPMGRSLVDEHWTSRG